MQVTELSIVARGAACLDRAELTALRQRSIPRFAATLRPQLLKQSDEQTLAAAVALDRAIESFSPDESPDFSAWSIVSASRYFGRTAFAAVIDKYQIDGAWGVSVHGIPHCSPHALASSLSLALASRGPCLGAAGTTGKELQAILAAAALFTRAGILGAWFVVSGWSGDAVSGLPAPEARCHAIALALVPAATSLPPTPSRGRIRIEPARAETEGLPSRDVLLCLASNQEQGLQMELCGGGIKADLELFPAAQVIGTIPRSIEGRGEGINLPLPPGEGRGEG
ncbi:MAG TPA: hypothetical protein VF278_09430, partial [Pirellulales bacterium]